MAYTPPSGDALVLNWTGALYTPPDGDSVVVEFSPTSPDVSYVVGATAGDALSMGEAGIENLAKSIFPAAIPPPAIGMPKLEWQQFIRTQGASALGVGGPVAYLWVRTLKPSGVSGIALPNPFVSGGERSIEVGGISAEALGTPSFYDELRPSSLGVTSLFGSATAATTPGIWPKGILSHQYGGPRVWQFPRPTGFLSYRSGSHKIDYGLKHLYPEGVDSYESGPSNIRDRAQKISHSGNAHTNYGDTYIKNTTRFIRVAEGVDALSYSSLTHIYNTRRFLAGSSFESLEIGDHGIINNTPSIFPIDFDEGLIGDSFISHLVRTVRPFGSAPSLYGQPVVTGTPAVLPDGIPPAGIGVCSITRKRRQVETHGSANDQYGEPKITFKSRKLRIESGIYQTIVDDETRVEHGIRAVETIANYSSMAFGWAWIDRVIRFVLPPSIKPPDLSPQTVYGPRKVGAFGFDSQRFGSRILPLYQYVAAVGFHGNTGSPEVRNRDRKLFPVSFKIAGNEEQLRYGNNRIFNLRQIIEQYFDDSAFLQPPLFPIPVIANRNRPINPAGMATEKYGLTLVENAGRAILAPGIAAPQTGEFYKSGSVTHKIRPVKPEAIEPPWFSTYSVIYNAARVLAPIGYSAYQFGLVDSVKNTRRYYDRIGGFDASTVEAPMISFKIRTIALDGNAIEAPLVKLPDVQLLTRYVDVVGTDYQKIGKADLVIHWTIVRPAPSLMAQYGYPALKNLTPELHVYGYKHDEFGDTRIRTQWREVFAIGSSMQQFGQTKIADRTFRLKGHGFIALRVGDKTTVTKTASPPYTLQRIILDGDMENNFGIGIPLDPPQVPPASITQNVLFVDGFDAKKFGAETRVTANTIRVEPGYQQLPIGDHKISMKIRTVAVQGFQESSDPSPAALSPRTIWAVMEAPRQAIDSNPRPAIPLHYVDGYGNKKPGATLGFPALTLKHRRITVRNIPDKQQSSYGEPYIFNRLTFVKPDGMQAMRIGWARLPTDSALEQFDSFDGTEAGQPSVRRGLAEGPQTLLGKGYIATQFGSGTHIDLFNRQIHPSGLLSLIMGSSSPVDTPYAWQRLHIGPPMPTLPQGSDVSIFGTQFISLRVRDIGMDGFDAFQCTYQIEAFDKRMRVTRGNKTIPTLFVTPVGISTAQHGVPNAKHAVRYIRPDGNADQFRKGASNV